MGDLTLEKRDDGCMQPLDLPGLEHLESEKQLNVNLELVKNLASAWQSVKTSLEQNTIVEVKDVLRQLLLYTAYTVLDAKYKNKIENSTKTILTDAIQGVEKFVIDSNLKKVCSALNSICGDPWEYAAFKDAATKELSVQVIDSLWENEGVIFLEARLEVLARGKKLKDASAIFMSKILHILLYKGRTRFILGNDSEENSDFDPYRFTFHNYLEYLEIYALLWSKVEAAFATNILTDLSPSIISEVISMLKQKSTTGSKGRLLPKLWQENTKDILPPLISLVLPPILDRVCEVGHIKSLVTLRLDICIGNNPDPVQRLEEMLDDLSLEKMKTSDNIYALSEVILEKFDHANKDTRRHYVNTFLKAILKDMNVIENLRADTPQDPVKLQEEYFKLSHRFVSLSNYFQDFKNMSRQLKLTAFSLNPTEKLFNELFPSDDESSTTSTSQIGTAPPNAAPCSSNPDDSDAISTPPSPISSFSTEGPAKTGKSENKSQLENPSPEEEEDLQLPETLVDDLNSVSQTSRWGALRSFTKGPEVKRLCTQLLKAGSDFLVKEKELEFVNPNYQKYAHLPVKYDDHDGFERGFYDPNKCPKRIANRKNNNGKIRGNNFVKRRIQNAANINRKVGQLSWKGNHHPPGFKTDLRIAMKNSSINHLTRPSTSSSKQTSRKSLSHSRNEGTNADLAKMLATIKQYVNKNVCDIKNQRNRHQQKNIMKTYEERFCHPARPMPGSYNWIPDPKPSSNSIPSSFTKGESQPVRKVPTRYIPRKTPFHSSTGWQNQDEDALASKLARGFIQEDARQISVRTQVDLLLPEVEESDWMAVEEKRNVDMYSNLNLMSSTVRLNSDEIPVELINLTARYLSLKSEQLRENGQSGDHDVRRTNRSPTTAQMRDKFRKMVFKDDVVSEFQFGLIMEMGLNSKRIEPSRGPSRTIKHQAMLKDATERMKTNLELETYKWKEVLDNAKKDMRTESEISRWPEFLSACNVTGENLTEEQIAFDKYRAEERLSRRSAPAFRCPPVNKKYKTQPELSTPSSVLASSGRRSSVDSRTTPSTHPPSQRGSKRRASSNASRKEQKYLDESDSEDSSSSSSYSTSAHVASNKRRYNYYPDRVIYRAIIAMLRGKTMKDAAEMNGIGRSALCKRLHVMKIREKGQLIIPPHLLEAMNVDAEGNSFSSDVPSDKRRKAYSEADLHEAIRLVIFRNFSCKSAQLKTGVPAPTVQFYCKNIKQGPYNDRNLLANGNPDDKLLEASLARNARSLEESDEDFLPALKMFGKGKITLQRAAILAGISFEKLVAIVDRFKVNSPLRKPGPKMSLDVDKRSPSPSHDQTSQQESSSTQSSDVSLLDNAIKIAPVPATPAATDAPVPATSVATLAPTSGPEIPPPMEKPKEKPRTTVNLQMLYNPIFRQSAESISGKPLAIPSTRPKKEILDDSTGEIKIVDDTGDDPALDKIIATLPPWSDEEVVVEKKKEINISLEDKNEKGSDVILVDTLEKKTVGQEEDLSQTKVIYHSVIGDPTPQKIVFKNNLKCRIYLNRQEVQAYIDKHPSTSSSSNYSLSPSLPSPEIKVMESIMESSSTATTEVKRSRRIHSMPKIVFKSGIPTRIAELNGAHPIDKDPTINGVIVSSSNKRKPEEVTVQQQQNGDSSSSTTINTCKKRRVDKEKENLLPVSASIAAAVAAVVTTTREPTISPATVLDSKIRKEANGKVQNVARKRTKRPQRRRRISSSSSSSHSMSGKDLGESANILPADEGRKSPDDDDFDDFEDESSDEDKDSDPDYVPDEMDLSKMNNKAQRNVFEPVLSSQTKPVECTPPPQDLNFINIISNPNTVCSLRMPSSSELRTLNFPLPVINIRTSHHTPLIIANNTNKTNQPPPRVFSTPTHPVLTHNMNIFQGPVEEAEEFTPPVVNKRRPTKKAKTTTTTTTNGNNLPTQTKPLTCDGIRSKTTYLAKNCTVKKVPQARREDPLLEVINLSDSDDEAEVQPQIIHQNGMGIESIHPSILTRNQEAIFSDHQSFSFQEIPSCDYRIVPDNDDDDDNDGVREILITGSQQQQQSVEIGGPIVCGIDSTEIISLMTAQQVETRKNFASIEDELFCEFRDKNSSDANVETRMSSYPSSAKPSSRQTSETDVSEISTFSSSSNNSPHQSEGELESGKQYTNVLNNYLPQLHNNEFYENAEINRREGLSTNQQEGDNLVASNSEKHVEMRKPDPTPSANRMENRTQLSQTSGEDKPEEIIRQAPAHEVSSPFQDNRQSPQSTRSVSPPIESNATPNISADPIESELSFLFEEKEETLTAVNPPSSPTPQQLQNYDTSPANNMEPVVSPLEAVCQTSSLGSPPIPILEPETNQTPAIGECDDCPPSLELSKYEP